MPAENKNGKGSSQKRSRSRALTPERSTRRRSRDHPPAKRRGLRSSDIQDERSRRSEFIHDRSKGASTSRPGRQTRNSRGIKRKVCSLEPRDDEDIEQPQAKRQRTIKEGNSSQSLSKSKEQESRRNSVSSKDGEEEGKTNAAQEEREREENEAQQKRKEEGGKARKQSVEDSKGQGKSDAEEDDADKEEEGEKGREGKDKDEDEEDDNGDTIAKERGGECTSTTSVEASKADGAAEGSSGADGGGAKSTKRERSSCMGCCNYREEEDKQIHEQLRMPPKGAPNVMPSGMLPGVGLSSLDELMPLPQHQQDNDDLIMDSLVEFLASSGSCVSPPLPPRVNSDGQLDLEWLLDMYDIDMSQEYHTNIAGAEDAL
ncbi:DEAD-box ATP-dependent RNA helicase 42-like [Ischnura elegans]|uniref:DEAD-box ATP-dependent RNA helicase 42-like n=1 Tax=Ischnura elegans TaxID=197161 RepID=UPI001ED895CF|nr:DEAD-box ATP-dependent RNA helicase 42-like [Ischnura elegans]XP_046403275.1 DEAD-box ATP-dependent RNA helicase 42-like [Ischnura elegans]